MVYYGISPSRELEIIGYYPQTTFSDNYNLGTNISHRNVIWNTFPSFVPEYKLKLNQGALVTDFIDATDLPTGIIVSEKFEKILSRFILPDTHIYPVSIDINKDILHYQWIHYINDLYPYIDFDKTTIEIFHKFNFNVLDTVLLKSEENLRQLRSSLGFEKDVRLKELYFNDNFPNYDIMVNNIIGYGNLISERLLNTLKENNITGYEATPYTIIKE
ncbi:MAG: hypothetical protein LBN18_08745 [Dysgonamonadaceae bacterium]|jgi:hypothetical protein|nr:hypothetical protein [Dysgonamonadaceae bacterium]